jgi:hypothetical protein
MLEPWFADLFCCSGLGADGYAAVFGAQAIYGYDIEPQPFYPYPFAQEDALKLLADPSGPLRRFRARHVSPPCQEFTTAGHLRVAQGGKPRFGDLLTPTLELLREHWNHEPWVAENVDDNQKKVRRIMEPRPGEYRIILCATMFGLPMWRHRIFLANFPLRQPEPTGPGVYGQMGCRHDTCPPDPITGRPRPWGVAHVPNDSVPSGGRTALDAEHGRQVMGSYRSLPWDRLKEGFPPAYASWVGADMLRAMS